ncbi:MAG TPA: hypothetical protein VHL98_17245 [Microvirga sp.]|jgi:hypothetical protein|nr:hypothetical protein [Microvirga sp.]
MSRTTRLALMLVGSIIALTALLGAKDRRFDPIQAPPGAIIKVTPQAA